jgi:hypothetical protein
VVTVSIDMSMPGVVTRERPSDPRAEEALIGWCLSHGTIPDDYRLDPELFWTGAYQVWAVMLQLVKAGARCDSLSVLNRMEAADREVRISGRRLDMYLADCVAWLPIDPQTVVDSLREARTLRDLMSLGEAMVLAAQTAVDGAADQVEAAERKLSTLGVVDSTRNDTLRTLDEFLGESYPEPEWVLRDYLCRGERMMVTGTPGLGKSTLSRQLGVCAAAGMDPFTGKTRPEVTVLAIDLENPEYIAQRRWHELRHAVHSHGRTIEEGRLWLDLRPNGLRLGNAEDRRWLRRMVTMTNPDLLVIGPAYKMMVGVSSSDRDELIARSVTEVIDDVRDISGCAVVLEAHAGKGLEVGGTAKVEPYGSALWQWWTDFGYGIRVPGGKPDPDARRRRLVEFVDWKLPRDPRKWPNALESTGEWMPWTESAL